MGSWQVREYQRQRFIEKIMKDLTNPIESHNGSDFLEFYVSLFGVAAEISKLARTILLGKDYSLAMPSEQNIFRDHVLDIQKKIKKFCRTVQEENFILCSILTEIVKQASCYFITEIHRQEIMESEKVYGAPAMAEVPFPEDED
jgi:hypothetical protein